MPTLKASQLKHFRQVLDEHKLNLQKEIRAEMVRTGNEYYAEIAGGVTDTGDESVATLFADLGQALAGRLIEQLRDIDVAIRRMDEGRYGLCVDCGGEVDAQRLNAYPTAKRCMACQTQHEKTYAQERKPSL